MQVDEQILKIVSDPTFDSFTAFELKQAFVEKVGEDHFGVVEMLYFVLAQMKLLVKNGVIVRSDTFSNIHVKTVNFQKNQKRHDNSSSSGLKDKHKAYKQQLLIGIGEAEEYQQLCKEYPELINELQPRYDKRREQNSKILGKIRVIEFILNNREI
jgi:hypothetical protein|tara:strand:+ start:5806 stop:6273 length:468 start_codon:yes stop_codon:yes gene_type:complete